MIMGKEVKTPYGIYRLKDKGGVQDGEELIFSAA